MKSQRVIGLLVFLIILFSLIASLSGIFSNYGLGEFEFYTIHGQLISIYGRGIYQNMSAEVAVQGIAHDYVTLFAGIPLLIIALFWTQKGSYRGRYLLAGVLGFFFITYLFYMLMETYNPLFLAYVVLTSLSFFALFLTLNSIELKGIDNLFREKAPVKFIGGYLILQAGLIALFWLSIVIPPLLDGTIIPRQVEHYTTLVVQGLDLSLLLPIAIVTGVLLLKKRPFGYLIAPVFMIFLALLMTALTGKIISQILIGVNTGPALILIPLMNIVTIVCAIEVIRSIKA